MSPTDLAVPKVKRVESKNKTDNHNAAKRAKRVAEKTKKKYERLRRMTTEYMYEQDRLREEAKRQKELEAVESKEALKLARKKKKLLDEMLRKRNDPSINASSNAKRLKGTEKKAAAEQTRKDAEAQEKIEKQRAKCKRYRDKARMDADAKRVFVLANSTIGRKVHVAEIAAEEIIEWTKWDYDNHCNVSSMNYLRYGVIDALFTCVRHFPTVQYLRFLGLKVLIGLLKAMHNTVIQRSEEEITLLRSTHLRLSTLNACDFIVQILETFVNHMVYAQACVEVWYWFVHPFTSHCSINVSPNIIDVCRNPRIESIVVWMFNQHEQHSTTDAYAQHCLRLMVVFVSNDASAGYRPEMCKAVIMAKQKYAGNDVVVTLCNQAITELNKNIQNKEKLNVIVT